MSFTTNKSMGEDAPRGTAQLGSGGASAPAYKPQVMRSLRMHPMLATGVAFGVMALVLAYALSQKAVYQAESLVYVEPALPKLLNDGSTPMIDSAKYDSFQAEQVQTMQRGDVINAAIASLPRETWAQLGPTPQAAAGNLRALLKVQRVGMTYQVSATLKGANAAKTADIVNAVVTAYLDVVHKASAAASDQRAQLLTEERERIETELRTASAEQAALGASIGVVSPSAAGGNPYDAELSGIRAQLMAAREAHDVAAAQLASLSGSGPTRSSGLTAAADEAIAGDAGLGGMKAAIGERIAALNGQMAGMTPSNPVYKQDQDEIADLQRTLGNMTTELRDKAARRLQDKLRSDLERTGDVEARLNGELARQIASASSAAPKLQRATEVAGDILRLDTRLAAVDDALRGLRMDSYGPGLVHLSLAATAPERPEPSRRNVFLLIALPLGLVCGIAAAVLARKRDSRLYVSGDVEDMLGFPPLAVLPARGEVSERVFDEYVLRLAAGVESAYRANGARTFLLTAVSLSTDARPVVDALTRKFEEIGVNVTVATASEMLTQHDVAAGAELERAGETGLERGNEGFVAANIARMKSEHGLVLIEAESLAHCGQTEYVARCADATILLIECGVTTREELWEAVSLLQRLNVTGIGTVLEELQLRFADTGFRRAIEVLESRQTDGVRRGARAVRAAEVEAAEPVFVRARSAEPAVAVEPAVAQVEPVAGPIEAPVVHEPVEVVQEPIAEPVASEAESVAASAEAPFVEPEREVEPSVVEEPVDETVQEAVARPTIRREFVAAAAAGPFLFGKAAQAESRTEENIDQTAAIGAAKTLLREKIAPQLSARSEPRSTDGDARMARNISWLDRLLGRSAGPAYSIVPDNDSRGDEGSEGEPEMPAEPARASESSTVWGRSRPESKKEDYDLPLLTRLEHISRSRPVAPPAASKSAPARLSIVPNEPEPETLVPEPHFAAEETVAAEPFHDVPGIDRPFQAETVAHQFESVVHTTETVADEPELMTALPTAFQPALSVPEEFAASESYAASETGVHSIGSLMEAPAEVAVERAIEPTVEEVAPVAAPVAAAPRGPRRPLTFQQLMGMAQHEPAAVAEAVPVESKPAEVTQWAAPVVAAAPRVVEAEELVEAAAPEVHVPVAAAPEPLQAPGAAYDDSVVEEWPAPAVEPMAVAPREVVSDWMTMPAREDREDKDFESIFRDPEPEPEAQQTADAESDSYDIEPVYREASRHLTTGRWDPIPPLRPSGIVWRDRPSPVPPATTNGAGHGRWPENAADAATPARASDPAFPTEPAPEPVLTRQWGLLSRFQQARISSGEVPAAPKKDDSDPALDAVGPGQWNRNRKG